MITVKDILSKRGPNVIITDHELNVQKAASMMAQANVGSVIIQEDDKILGIFTERDLLKRVIAKDIDIHKTSLNDVMTSPVKTCRLEDDIWDCAAEMSKDRIRHMAILDYDNKLMGVIGFRDIMAAQVEDSLERIKRLEHEQSC